MDKKSILIPIFSKVLFGIFILVSLVASGQQPVFESAKAVVDYPDAQNFYAFQLSNFDRFFFIRLGINILSMLLLIRGIYFSVYKRREYFFTFFMFNIVIFIITFLLNSKSGFSLGAAFGLFAIFAMLRYRTEDISTRDMTYLFLSITIGLITSINKGTLMELLVINAIILIGAYLLEGNLLNKSEFFKSIEYEKIELIAPEKRPELIADLKSRTGLNIHKVDIKRIDFLRDSALLKVYYFNEKNRAD